MEDDRLKTLLADHQGLFDCLSKALDDEEERLPKDTHEGLLNEQIAKLGIEISTPRRRFLQAAAVALAQLSPAGRIAKVTLETAAAVGGVVSGYAITEGWTDKRKAEWEVSPVLTAKLSRMPYNDPRIDGLLEGGAARNRGELALIKSYILHRDRQFEMLKRNTDELRKAFNNTDNPDGRALIVGRLAIDYNAMGAGRDAVESLDLLDTAGVTDQHTLAQCLDYGASIRLNNLTSDEFSRLHVPGLEKLTNDWATLNIDLEGNNGIDDVAKNFGLHAFSVVMLRKVMQIAKLNDESQIRAIRKEWVEETLELAEAHRANPARAEFAEDAFYSLHRPAFHAFVTNDYDGAKAICDYYFGRSGRPEGAHMTVARDNVLKKMGPGVQWMYLLDAARFAQENRLEDGRIQLNIFAKRANVSLNYVVMKTFPFVFERCGLSIKGNFDSVNQKRSRIPEVSLMRNYAEAVSREVAVQF